MQQILEQINEINKELDNPEEFLVYNEEKSNSFKKTLKAFYDFMKKTEDASDDNAETLPELIIKDVDNEQIYQQLQLHYTPASNSLLKYFSKCLADPDKISFNLKMNDEIDSKKKDKIKKMREKRNEESSDDEEDDKRKNSKNKKDFAGNEDDDGDSDAAIVEENLDAIKRPKEKNDVVFGIPDGSDSEISDFDVDENEDGDEDDEDDDDDDEDGLGGLDDLEGLNGDESEDDEEGEDDDEDEEDFKKKSKAKKDNKAKKGIMNVDDLDSDEIDEDLVDMYGDLGDEKEVLEIGKNIEYRDEDFDGEPEISDKKNNKNDRKKVSFTKDLFENDDKEVDDELDENGEKKSSFEKRQEKFKQKVDQIHESMLENVQNKPWQLKGEITSKARPQDSLLEEFLEFDHTTRQAPMTSSDLNEKLEEIIKQRIKDKAFDDVERKVKPVEMNYEYKKQVTLDHEKSKLSLSQVYEQEYLNKAAEIVKPNESGETEKKNPKHEEIRKDLENLFIKLDALSNFHYTPKAPQPELKVVSNMPTIAVEEVAPVNVSDANLLAPEEIYKKVDALPMSKEEEGKKDKNRKLRKKKIVSKKIKEKKENLLKLKQAANPDDPKLNKQLALEKLKKQSKNLSNNLKIVEKKKKSKVDASLKSSSAFFKELNDKGINSKSKAKKHKTKDESQKSSKKLKL